MRRGKRGRGIVNANRSRIRERKTIVSTLAIAIQRRMSDMYVLYIS